MLVGSWKPIVYGAVSSAACYMWTIRSQVFALHLVRRVYRSGPEPRVVFFIFLLISDTHTYTTLCSQPANRFDMIFLLLCNNHKQVQRSECFMIWSHMTCAYIVQCILMICLSILNALRCLLFEAEVRFMLSNLGARFGFNQLQSKRNKTKRKIMILGFGKCLCVLCVCEYCSHAGKNPYGRKAS